MRELQEKCITITVQAGLPRLPPGSKHAIKNQHGGQGRPVSRREKQPRCCGWRKTDVVNIYWSRKEKLFVSSWKKCYIHFARVSSISMLTFQRILQTATLLHANTLAEHRRVNPDEGHTFTPNVSNSKTSALQDPQVVIDVRGLPRWRTGSRAESPSDWRFKSSKLFTDRS